MLALLGFILTWVPVFGWILWALGLIFSCIGIFRMPRSLAVAGLVISFIGIIVLIIFIGALAGLAAVFMAFIGEALDIVRITIGH